MGALHSDHCNFKNLTVLELGVIIASLGEPLSMYRDNFEQNKIDGELLMSITSQDLEACLESIDITNIIHRKKFRVEFSKMK